MATHQLNLKIPETLFKDASKHVEKYGYRNVQELVLEGVREIVYDDEFSEKEIELIDKIIKKTLEQKAYGTSEDLKRALSE